MKTWLAFGLVVVLAGCSSTRVAPNNHYVLVEPPAEFLYCPQLQSIPDADTLTNAQVAQVIITLDRNNKVCALNMRKIKEFIELNRKAYRNK